MQECDRPPGGVDGAAFGPLSDVPDLDGFRRPCSRAEHRFRIPSKARRDVCRLWTGLVGTPPFEREAEPLHIHWAVLVCQCRRECNSQQASEGVSAERTVSGGGCHQQRSVRGAWKEMERRLWSECELEGLDERVRL